MPKEGIHKKSPQLPHRDDSPTTPPDCTLVIFSFATPAIKLDSDLQYGDHETRQKVAVATNRHLPPAIRFVPLTCSCSHAAPVCGQRSVQGTTLLHVRKVPESNLDRSSVYPAVIRLILSFPPGRWHNSASNYAPTVPLRVHQITY